MSFQSVIMNFFRRNGGTILTCISAAGVIGTSYLSGKAAVKADKELKTLGEDATFKEKFKALAPIYIPPAAAATATVLCMFGANGLSRKQQASMLAAGALVEQTYHRYKDKAEELLGDHVVDAGIAKDQEVPDIGQDERLFYYEYYSDKDHPEYGAYFTSTIEKVYRAEMELNRTYLLRRTAKNDKKAKKYPAYVTLNEFFKLLDLNPIDGGNYKGWSEDISDEFFGYSWIDFEHVDTTLLDGLECTIITNPKHMEPTILA